MFLNTHFGFSIKKRLERRKSGSVETSEEDAAIIQMQGNQGAG